MFGRKNPLAELEKALEEMVAKKNREVPEAEKKYFPEDQVEALFDLAAKETAAKAAIKSEVATEAQHKEYLLSRRNLWLFIEKTIPETVTGNWTLDLGIHPFVHPSNS